MNLIEFKKIKKTTNREITIICKAAIVRADELTRYVNRYKIQKACKTGCPNYGKKWSCPPYSKSYDDISWQYNNAIVFCFSTSMSRYLDIKNKYLAMKAANVTLKSSIEKAARILEKQIDGYSLLSGSCRLCKPCRCKQQEPCNHPNNMRYSMEATYLDVDALSKKVLSHELLWYKNKVLPEYTTTVSMVLTNYKIINNNELKDLFETIV
ncbi:DUF2284 domain-containing protein [Clostridium sp. WILCCON 0269]|uniref:DUF2284 domain-containing protein n=1 Tax=Candidatus Clostridium eludens TaxID=3381663 RepID=A0ABW8SLH1_9CLOT